MAEPQFGSDDDLPRTFRRERENRDREAAMAAAAQQAQTRLHEQGAGTGRPEHAGYHDAGAPYAALPDTGTVTRLDIPFGHLVNFFLKAVIAAIPALILLTGVMIAGGQVLKAFVPQFRQFEIIIKTPDAPVAAAPKGTEPVKGTPTKK